ncbi:Lipopolysaccharide assembly protein B [Methanosarcinales archaeon]|nr:Lipopolysaccharide assembly protein B [Methanosarcinales archaeon]
MVLSLNYRDFEIQLSGESPNHYIAKAMDNGNATETQTFELRTGELKVIEGLQRLEEKAVASSKKETFHIEFGKELYNKVFSGKLGEYFKNCLEEAQDNDMGLRVCLRFDESAQEIAVLPWEFLHDGSDFLVTSRNTLISRMPARIKKIKKAPLESILRMLVVILNPDDPRVAPLNTELEQTVILEAVEKLCRDYKMEVDFTYDATFETIQGYLNEKDYHIVHFTGHGIFDEEKRRGYLVLETGHGKARMVDNAAIADLLEGRGVRLVVLSACQSGKTSNKEAYADLASILAKNKIPAVAAMQYSILDLSATKFASSFYQAIASGKPIDLALTEARIAMKNAEKSNGLDFATPVLYLCDPNCLTVSKIKPEASELFNKPTMLGDVAIIKKGFVGRRKELRILQKDFMSDVKRAAIIYGFGGLGKTVLATRLMLRMNQHFDGLFGMKCSATTKPEDILNRLNAFLLVAGIQQLNQVLCQPVSLEAKTAMLVNILNQKRFLIIFDNFEDCLNESRSNIASLELKVFIRHLLNNTISSSKFIITTRYNFDPLDGRLTGAIEHISLSEMSFPETVWLMNNYKELADLGMEKKHKIYKAIGGHPWTIGQFAIHAAVQTVDGLLIELEPLKKELIKFTLLDKSYSKLDKNARTLMLHASIYQEAVPVEALSWIMGNEIRPNPSISDPLTKLFNWGLMAKQEEREGILYLMHTIVREFAEQELEKENLDRKQMLIRAAQYYEKLTFKEDLETVFFNVWNHVKAREYYYQAEQWEKAASIVNSVSDHLLENGNVELVLNLLNESIDTTSGRTKTLSMACLGNFWIRLGDIEKALKIYTDVKETFEKSRDEIDKKLLVLPLHQLGEIYRAQNNLDKATELYLQSLKIEEELDHKIGISVSLHALGVIHQARGNYGDAIQFYKRSLEIDKKENDRKHSAENLHALGNIYLLMGKFEKGIELCQRSLKIADEFNDQRKIAQILASLGSLYLSKGDQRKAIEHYQRSLKLGEMVMDREIVAGAIDMLGWIYETENNLPLALEKYSMASDIYKELKSQQYTIELGYIARLRKKMGQEAFNRAMDDIIRKHDT